MTGMKLGHLRAFVAIADAGGFARAAGRLNLTQSAISRQIALLENELGVRLFDRDGRDVKLTSPGEDLLRRSRHLLNDAAALGERARELRGGQVGTLRIGASPQVIENILAPFLVRFLRAHPGVDVQLLESGSARHGQLERGEIHLAMMPFADAEPFQRRLLYPIHVMAVMAVLARSHRLGRRTVLDIADLAEERLLLLKQGFGARGWFDAACSAAELRPRILLESAAPATLVALAEVGHGIAIIPSNVQIVPKSIRRAFLTHRDLPIGRWSSIARNQHRFLPRYGADFVDELVAVLQRKYPGQDLIRRAPSLPRP
jgi:LysR family transcriptional regulator, cyn operon transcriptional activator